MAKNKDDKGVGIPEDVMSEVKIALGETFVTQESHDEAVQAADDRAEKFERELAEAKAAAVISPKNADGAKRKASMCKLLLISEGRDTKLEGRIDFGYEREVYTDLAKKALSVGADAAGGFLVPEEFQKRLILALTGFVAVRAVQAADGAIPMPMTTDTLRVPRGAGAVTADWTAENVDATLSDPTTEQVSLNLKDLIAATQLSNKLLELSNPAADDFVERRLIRAIVEKESIDFLRRTAGGNGPEGIKDIAGVQTFIIAGGAGTNVAVEDLEKAENLLLDAGFAPPYQWIGNAKAYGKIANLKDNDGRRLFEPSMVTQAGNAEISTIFGASRTATGRVEPLGYRWYFESQIPNNLGTGGDTEFYLCKGSTIMIGDGAFGTVLSASKEFKFLADATVVKAVRRTDVNLEQPAGLVQVNGALA